MEIPFKKFKELWHHETFMEGAFGLEQDFDAYLDDPTTDFEDNLYEHEINQYMIPTFGDDKAIEDYLIAEILEQGVYEND